MLIIQAELDPQAIAKADFLEGKQLLEQGLVIHKMADAKDLTPSQVEFGKELADNPDQDPEREVIFKDWLSMSSEDKDKYQEIVKSDPTGSGGVPEGVAVAINKPDGSVETVEIEKPEGEAVTVQNENIVVQAAPANTITENTVSKALSDDDQQLEYLKNLELEGQMATPIYKSARTGLEYFDKESAGLAKEVDEMKKKEKEKEVEKALQSFSNIPTSIAKHLLNTQASADVIKELKSLDNKLSLFGKQLGVETPEFGKSGSEEYTDMVVKYLSLIHI